VQKPIPSNSSILNAPQDAALRQEEFGDLSQAADQFDAARDYYAVALDQVRTDDRATRARLLIKLAECDHRQGRYDRALAQLSEARTAARPLRERTADIPALAHFFLRRFAAEAKKRFTEITPEAQAQLLAYAWPGNIRELQNVMERAVVLGAEGTGAVLVVERPQRPVQA